MVTPPLRTKSLGFKVSEEEYAQLETAARTGGSPLYTKSIPTQVSEEEYAHLKAAAQASGQQLAEWCREAILREMRDPDGLVADLY